MMEDCLHTSSENLSKLVRWAHSHGTICALIPNLQHLLTEGSHGNLTAMWGCSAGHAYHWPLPATCKTGIKERGTCYQDSRSIHSDSLSLQGGASAHQSSPGGERFLTRTSKAKGGDSSQTRDSCDFSNCSDDNTEADDNTEEYNSNLFDIVCESSATDEDGDVDYEPHHRPRKRATQGGMPGPQRPGSEDRAQGDKPVKRIKQETAEDYYTVANAQLAAAAGTNSGLTSHSSQSPKPNNPQPRMPQPGLPPKPTQLDADSLGGGVGGVASSLLGLGRSSPHIPMLAKPLRGSVSGSVLKPSAMNSGSPRHQDSSSGSTQGLSTLTGAAGEMIEGLTSEDLLKPGGTEGPFGDLTPSSPIGMNSDLDLMAAHDLGADTKEEATVGPGLCEIERLRALLSVERSRSQQLGETVSSLKQDKELLQQELTKKAELICDFLQDQLRPEKRRGHSSSQLEVVPGSSSHMGLGFSDEGATFENPALFDSFEEVELHPMDRHRVMKSSKRSRDGENTRVRMKNVVGVIARYMAALQEFRRSVSMKVAFDRVGVDRNTISRTAAIAELSLAAPEVFHALPPWDEKEETLAHYAHRCRQAMDDTIRAKIKTMKAKGDLLPIVSK
uniref:Si:ch211-126i22.5 n=2 Tax=Esox lucius TaxID=8010 RepID=A0A6Q2Z1T8_ESOLU